MRLGISLALTQPASHGTATPPGPPLDNLVGWYVKGTGITSSGGGAVSAWADQSGAGHDLVQATGASQPALQGDGTIIFDGVDDTLKTLFTLSQPCTMYHRMDLLTDTGQRVADGGDFITALITRPNGSLPAIALFAGSGDACLNSDMAFATWESVACVFNGASSLIQVGSGTPTTGSPGTSSPNGLTVGGDANAASCQNVQLAASLIYNVAHDATQRAAVIAYLDTL